MAVDSASNTTRTDSHPRRASSQANWKFGAMLLAVIAVVALVVAYSPRRDTSSAQTNVALHVVDRGEVLVTVTEQGTLESANNTEIKCRVRGDNTIIWVVESGSNVAAGDELVKLDTLFIEEEISERTKFAHLAQSEVARSKADVAKAKLAISEYLDGRFVSELASLEKDLAVAESRLLNAKDRLKHSRMMARSEYASELEVEEREFAVSQAELEVKLTGTKIDVLKRFTKREELATLQGALNAAKALHEANVETAHADEQRLQRAEEELNLCVVRAPRAGMVIYPTSKAWKEAPDIEEGATVHKDQVLLLMPDLTNMQVKVGIHESVVDRVYPGISARVSLAKKTLDAEIISVAPVAKPAGWWTGNVVKYDTTVKLASTTGLKPGMSVEVEVELARHEDVLRAPMSAIVATTNGYACWVAQDGELRRRDVRISDNNDSMVVVEGGLNEGDKVVLDPLASVKEAQDEAAAVQERRTLQDDMDQF